MAAFELHRAYSSAKAEMMLDMSGYMTKPSRAKRMASSATSPKVLVPNRERAVIQASGAAGTTVRRTPSGMVPAACRTK
ncbi:hypothetical protein ASE00_01800 [Sphingomonas sp. Root710]|nr:hypothetical protein ASE00_01800 [Sphingomonas sp. Root710]